jgi:DNA modification methylase
VLYLDIYFNFNITLVSDLDARLNFQDKTNCDVSNNDNWISESTCQSIDRELKLLLELYHKTKEPIQVDFRKLVDWVPYADSYTHYIHTYPAKLLKHIPIFFLNSSVFLPDKKGLVLDPFCGSGTVLLESLLAGHSAIGCDANPLARLIAKVKTTKIDVNEAINFKNIVIKSAKRLRKHEPLNVVNVDHWFPKQTQLDLSKLKRAIDKLPRGDVYNFLMSTFSSIIKKVSYSDPNLSVPVKLKPEKYIKNDVRANAEKRLLSVEMANVFLVFEKQFQQNIKRVALINAIDTKAQSCEVVSIDARKVTKSLNKNSELQDSNSVDFILTSPPYAGAQKYVRASSLNLGWLGYCEDHTLRDYEKLNIGREHYPKAEYQELLQFGIVEIDQVLSNIWAKNPLRAHINGNYLAEMKNAILEMYRVLKPEKYCVIVIGNNEVCGELFETQKFVRLLAQDIGFSIELVLIDDIHSRGLMTKRNKTASIINSEWILVFKK